MKFKQILEAIDTEKLNKLKKTTLPGEEDIPTAGIKNLLTDWDNDDISEKDLNWLQYNGYLTKGDNPDSTSKARKLMGW